MTTRPLRRAGVLALSLATLALSACGFRPLYAEPGVALGLSDIDVPVDVVDVFRRSEAAGQFADEAVRIGARGVWFQLGVVDQAAFERTTAAGVPMVMDTCPAIEWRRR